jgi:hypothetical protein
MTIVLDASGALRPAAVYHPEQGNMSMPNDDEILRPAGAPKRLTPDEVRDTLANWRSKGLGPKFTRIGGRIFYPLADLKRWEDENASGKPPPEDAKPA